MSLGKPVTIALRVLQFVWALLVMALIGDMIHDSYAGDPAIVNYCMFVAVFAMLSLIYLIPATFRDSLSIHPLFPLVVDLLNVLFWFCAAVAMAAYLGVHSCSNTAYVNRNFITNGNTRMNSDPDTNDNNDNSGSNANHGRCREAQASTAFLFFGFFCFAVSCVFTGLGTRGSANVRAGGIRRGPAMSQV